MERKVNYRRLIRRLADRSATVGVVGMGYVGLPLALSLAQEGFKVIGVDIDQKRIKSLSQGKLTFAHNEPDLAALLQKEPKKGRLRLVTDHQELSGCDAVVITVQTPLQRGRLLPDYRILKSAVRDSAAVMKTGALLVVQSTVAPGTSARLIKPLVEKVSPKRLGRKFWYAHVPERIIPGKILETLRDLPRIIGSDDPLSARAARLLYEPITRGQIDEANVVTAEMAKTAENAHRFMDINFANALALLCEEYGVSYQAVRQHANKRDNVHLLQPGAGIGGHCIPKDPWLLVWQHAGGQLERLFREGEKINQLMAAHVVELVKYGLRKVRVHPGQARLAILGYSYREGSDDVRDTPAKRVINKLRRAGMSCSIHDPLVVRYRQDLKQVIEAKDAVVVLTAHQEYRDLPLRLVKRLLKHPLIIDGRQTWDKKKAVKQGFTYLQIGEPPLFFSDRRKRVA